MRRSFLRWFTLAESRSMFLDARGTPLLHPAATLVETLQVLAEHHQRGDAALMHAALDRLMSLDVTNADSETIAFFKPQNITTTTTTTSASATTKDNHNISNINTAMGIRDGSVMHPLPSSPSSSSSGHLILQLMFAHANDAVVRERCCRCIANMCQLSSSSLSSSCSTPHAVEPLGGDPGSCTNSSIADMLVEHGAVELALGTLAMSLRLSAKGLAWSALAVLNLVCLSRDGAQRAAKANGDSVLADVITGMTHEPVSAKGLSSDQRVAMDAMLGALTRLLTIEADDNAAGVRFRYEQASYGTVEAVGRALAWLSKWAVHEIRCADDTGAKDINGSRRGGVLSFLTATPSQQAAVLAFLPPLQKAWMALRSLSSCSKNLPVVYEALHTLADVNGLRGAVDAVLLFGVELEGLSAVGAVEEAELQQNTLLHAMEAFVDLTATRKDLGERVLAESAAAASAAAEGDVRCDAAESVSAVIPTEAALSVWDTLAAGDVCSIAVSTIVRLHAAHKEAMGRDGGAHAYDGAVFDLLAKCVLTLANLAGHDVAVSSTNTLAALYVMLQDARDILSALKKKYCTSSSGSFLASASHDELVTLVQQCALAGQMYAALWSILRTPEGAHAAKELNVPGAVRELQSVLEAICSDVFPDAAAAASDGVAPQSSPPAAAQTTEAIAAAEETMRRLIPLGRRVLQCVELVAPAAGGTGAERRTENG